MDSETERRAAIAITVALLASISFLLVMGYVQVNQSLQERATSPFKISRFKFALTGKHPTAGD